MPAEQGGLGNHGLRFRCGGDPHGPAAGQRHGNLWLSPAGYDGGYPGGGAAGNSGAAGHSQGFLSGPVRRRKSLQAASARHTC